MLFSDIQKLDNGAKFALSGCANVVEHRRRSDNLGQLHLQSLRQLFLLSHCHYRSVKQFDRLVSIGTSPVRKDLIVDDRPFNTR